MKVAFDLSLMHLDIKFSYLSFGFPKKRVNVDRREKGDKLFENIKGGGKQNYRTELNVLTLILEKKQIKRGRARTGCACLIELAYLTFGFLLFWNIPSTKRVNIFLYVQKRRGD